MTAAADTVMKFVEQLAFCLRHDSPAGALTAIDRIEESLPALRETLQEQYRQKKEAAVAAASGNSLTHDWVVTESGINCLRCHLTTIGEIVVLGALPECGPSDCPHLVIMGDDDTSRRCTYCKTAYPATAGTREGVSS